MERSQAGPLDGLRLDGDLVLPGEGGWDDARGAWNLAADQHPEAVVFAESVDDVARVLERAADEGLGVGPQGTGHGAAPRASERGYVLLRTDRIDWIEVGEAQRLGRFGAGVIWRDALEAAADAGLVGPAGSSPDVGVVGYTVGGGFGWLSRRWGLACNRVRSFDVVTADGSARRVDAESDPELFWALRGGGGAYAVVSSIELELEPLAAAFGGGTIYAADSNARSAELLSAYAEWAAGVSDEVTSAARFLRLPPIPDVPEPLRDRPLLMLAAVHAGDPAEGEATAAPIRGLGEPVLDTFRTMSPAELVTVSMDPEQPVPATSDHALLRELPAEALDAFVEVCGPESGSPLLLAELRQAGGALAEAPPDAGALGSLPADFVFNGVGALLGGPDAAAAINERLDLARERLAAWSADTGYLNFADRALAGPEALFDAPTVARLREVKRSYDPQGVIRAGHGLG